MKRLFIAPLVVMAALTFAPPAHGDSGSGAFKVDCTYLFPQSDGGTAVLTPPGGVNHGCRYAGPAEGGGADTAAYGTCVLTPAGNLNCNLR